jgi:hypothetical protein
MKKSRLPIQDLLNDLIKNGITLIFGYIFSTALIGSAGYLLFNTQPEVDEINRLGLEIKSQIGEIKAYNDMESIFTNGYITQASDRMQMVKITSYLEGSLNMIHLDKAFISEATMVIPGCQVQVINEKGKISGFSIRDEQLKKRQQNIISWYENELANCSEALAMIVNWEKETIEDKNERIAQLDHFLITSIELTNTIEVQKSQIDYYLENVKNAEISILETELQRKLLLLRLRKTVSWIGIFLGISLLASLSIYVRRNYFEEIKTLKGKKRASDE